MQTLKQQITKIRKKIKKYFSEPIILDIIIIGSYLKDKKNPNDLDIIVIFTEKNYEKAEKILPKLKDEIASIENNVEIHLELSYADKLFTEEIFQAIIHEGFSLKHNKRIADLIGFSSKSLFTFSLNNLTKSKKVQFSYALYGRKKDGLIYQEKGEYLGKGSFIVPTPKEELFKELLNKWDIKYIMFGTKFSLLGRMYRIIFEPICYITGLLLTYKERRAWQ